MLSQEAIEKMLGIKAGTRVTAEGMAKFNFSPLELS